MLYYPPYSKGPPFEFPTIKGFLESPNQKLSPQLCFRSFSHTQREIWRLEKCSTIRPLPGAHYFGC